jgi:hypothetical protein
MAKFSQKQKDVWVKFDDSFMEKRGEFLPIVGISVTFCQIFTPKKEKKEKTGMDCRGRSKSQIAMCEVVGSKLYSQGFD